MKAQGNYILCTLNLKILCFFEGHQIEGKRDWPDQQLGTIVLFFRNVIGVWKGTQTYFQGHSPHLFMKRYLTQVLRLRILELKGELLLLVGEEVCTLGKLFSK